MPDEQETQEKMYNVSQEEAAYVPVSTIRGKACGNCRWFCAGMEGESVHCHLVDSYPEYILPTGYCNRWEGKPVPEVPEQQPVPVMIVEPPEMEMALDPEKERRILKALPELIRKVFGKKEPGDFAIYKDADGKPRWIGKFTNNFQDRTKEIISDKALDGYLSRLDSGLVPMPELRLGHIPGSKHGQADMIFGVGNFLVAVGSFDEGDFAQACLKFYEKNAASMPLSHGFTAPEWAIKDGVYAVVNIFEVSTLPPPLVAANPYTQFEVETMKQIRPEQLEALARVVGKEKAETLVAQWQDESKDLVDIGVKYKDFADVEAAQAVEKPEDKKDNAAELLVTLVEDFGTSVEVQKAFDKRLDKVEADIKANYTAKLAEVQKALTDATALIEVLKADRAAAPRIATESAATENGITAEQKAALTALATQTQFDPFYADLKIPKKI